ncbi:MAG: phosphoglycerate mutase family protein [Acidobacteriota bacterium]
MAIFLAFRHAAEEGVQPDEIEAACTLARIIVAPVAVVISAEPLTQETGQMLAKALELPLVTEKGLGPRLIAPRFATRDRFLEVAEEVWRKPNETIWGEESNTDAQARLIRALFALLITYSARDLILVTHGSALALLANQVNANFHFEFWSSLHALDAVAFEIAYDGAEVALINATVYPMRRA